MSSPFPFFSSTKLHLLAHTVNSFLLLQFHTIFCWRIFERLVGVQLRLSKFQAIHQSHVTLP